MASIQHRTGPKGDRWRVVFRTSGTQHVATFIDEAGAESFKQLVEKVGGEAARRIRRERVGVAGKALLTVTQAVRLHIDALEGITDGTRRRYHRIGDLVEASEFGLLPLDALERGQVVDWLAGMRTAAGAPLAAKTKMNRQALLSEAIARQVERGALVKNPVRGIKVGDTEREEMVILSADEIAGFLDPHILYRHWYPLVLTLVGTGMRFGEATALQVRDLDLSARVPKATVARAWKATHGHGVELGAPKTRKGRRRVALASEVVEVIRPLLEGRPRDGFVFVNKAGRPVQQNAFWRVWRDTIDRANAAGVTSKRPRIHDLRHTYASHQIDAGTPINVLQNQLGHESAKTTLDVYGHLLQDAHAVAAAAASSFLAQAAPEVVGVLEQKADAQLTQ